MNDMQQIATSATPRAGELPGNQFAASRSNRVFRLPNGWYFSTRERIPLGPFTSADRAEYGIAEFLHFLNEAPEHVRNLFQRNRFSVA